MSSFERDPDATTGDHVLRRLLGWDESWYLQRYPDVGDACQTGKFPDPFLHYLWFGRREGRFPSARAEGEAQRGGDPRIAPDELRVDLGEYLIPLDWPVQGEPAKTFLFRLSNGFFATFLGGAVILDIGYRGGDQDAVPILPHAIGVDLDYPGYDGVHLP